MGDPCFSSLLLENYQEVSRGTFNNLFFLLNMDLSLKISVLDIFRFECCIYETEKKNLFNKAFQERNSLEDFNKVLRSSMKHCKQLSAGYREIGISHDSETWDVLFL